MRLIEKTMRKLLLVNIYEVSVIITKLQGILWYRWIVVDGASGEESS